MENIYTGSFQTGKDGHIFLRAMISQNLEYHTMVKAIMGIADCFFTVFHEIILIQTDGLMDQITLP